MFTFPTEINIVICRIICTIFLHLLLASELKNSLDVMKYSLNQHYKFTDYWVVFLVFLIRGLIILGIEISNILLIVSSDTIPDVI